MEYACCCLCHRSMWSIFVVVVSQEYVEYVCCCLCHINIWSILISVVVCVTGVCGVHFLGGVQYRGGHEGGRIRLRHAPRCIPAQRMEYTRLRHCDNWVRPSFLKPAVTSTATARDFLEPAVTSTVTARDFIFIRTVCLLFISKCESKRWLLPHEPDPTC